MRTATIAMAVIFAALIAVAIWRGGGSLQKGFTFGGKAFLNTLPLLVIAFAIARFLSTLIVPPFAGLFA